MNIINNIKTKGVTMRIGDIQLNQNKILRISKDTVNMVTFYQYGTGLKDGGNEYEPSDKVIAFHVNKLDEVLLSLIHFSQDTKNTLPN